MGATTFTIDGLRRVDRIVTAHVESGTVPGAVWLLARGDHVHVGCAGVAHLGSGQSIGRDALFRISSMTKPVTAVAALSCVEDGLLRLDESVDRLLPELADRMVLEHEDAPLSWVVPARRPILVRDLLTFTMGLGIVMAPPGTVPLADALVELELGQGPPAPDGLPEPDEWIRRLGTLPLLHHPGARWMYGTGSDVLGVALARATGRPFEQVLQERVLEPLGMGDTSFWVDPSKRDRLVTAYRTDSADGSLVAFDEPDGQWSHPPAFPSGAAGLVSSIDDMFAFARMLLDGGAAPAGRVLSRAAVEAMTTNQLTAEQAHGAGLVDGWFASHGWGFGVSVVTRRADIAGSVGSYGWDGGLGTCWMNDPGEGLVTLLMTQGAWSSPAPPPVCTDFRAATWAALAG